MLDINLHLAVRCFHIDSVVCLDTMPGDRSRLAISCRFLQPVVHAINDIIMLIMLKYGSSRHFHDCLAL